MWAQLINIGFKFIISGEIYSMKSFLNSVGFHGPGEGRKFPGNISKIQGCVHTGGDSPLLLRGTSLATTS